MEEVPVYLREISKVMGIHREEDGAYHLELMIEVQGQHDFIPYLSYRGLTEEEKQESEWIKEFRKRYAYLWGQGYCMTSKTTKDGTMYGCTKDGEFTDLELYRSDGQNVAVTPIVVKAVTSDLNTEVELFHSLRNGYDAMISAEQTYLPVKFKKKNKCRVCACETYKIYVHIHNTGRQDLMECDCEKITDKNWTNAFDWISIDLECSKCGKKTKRWFETETM